MTSGKMTSGEANSGEVTSDEVTNGEVASCNTKELTPSRVIALDLWISNLL